MDSTVSVAHNRAGVLFPAGAPPTRALQAGDPARLHAAIAAEADPVRVMRRVVEAALVLIEHADGSTIELDDHAGHMVYVCGAGSLQAFEGMRIALEGSLAGLAVRSGRLLCCDDSETDPRVDRDACRRVHARALICVPLRRQAEAVGVLKVSSKMPHAFSDGDVVALEALSEFVAAAIAGASDLMRASRPLLEEGSGRRRGSEDSMARFVADVLRPTIATDLAARTRIERMLATRRYVTVFQPIVALRTRRVVGVEALTRFRADPTRPPDEWFAEAHGVGLGVELELATSQAALAGLDRLPSQLYMSVNASPQLLLSGRFAPLCSGRHAPRLVIELTEHVVVEDYPELLLHLRQLRGAGVRLAIDDTGAGISSLAHILKLGPDIIKLDRALTSGIDSDPARRALAIALVAFAAESGAQIVAEGVETGEELAALCELGITFGQGYHLAKPAPLRLLRSSVAGTLHPLRGDRKRYAR